MQTKALICKLGKEGSWYESKGSGKGQFSQPYGVAVSADSSCVVVVESVNHRVQVLRLAIAADKSTAKLEFVRFIGTGEKGTGKGAFRGPRGIALRMLVPKIGTLKPNKMQHTRSHTSLRSANYILSWSVQRWILDFSGNMLICVVWKL